MAIIPDWTQFRLHFGIGGAASNQLLIVSTGAFSFDPGPPPVISRAVGDFVADGQLAGMRADVLGTALNDGRYGPLVTVEVKKLTLANADILQTEPLVGSTITSIFRTNDEVEWYPSMWHPTTDLVRSGGFDAGFIGIEPFTGLGLTISCNSGAADSSFGVDEYHWYLDQKQDDPARQYLSIIQKPDTATESFSGSVQVNRTPLAVTELGFTVTTSVMRELFKLCDLYVKRISDGAIQWAQLYFEMQQP